MIFIDKNKLLRGHLKYYAYLIKEEYEWIDGLDKHNIDNSELEYHYDMILDYIFSCYYKIQELFPEECK